MSRFSPDTIERVRESADIVEVVSAYTDLRRQGERFVGLCPFHDERSPSFSVKPREGFYYCFGCEAGGDTIRFVQEKEGLAFPDAVEALAERYGVEVEREDEDPKAEEARRRRGRLGEALTRVAAFYESFLWESPKAEKARTYLTEERGLGEEVLRNFGVGYAPSAWDSVLTRGQRAGYSVEELLAAGLIQRSSNKPGSHYDRFRARITFPVRDHRGRVVGFGARGMGPDAKPKYLNSPENEMYRKSEILYGIDLARGPIAKSGRAIVVEGYTDVIALHQAGVNEVVAVMGTAFNVDQLKPLGGYAEEIVLALDADQAGLKAMLRASQVLAGKMRLLIAAMPEGVDPAEMLMSQDGKDQFVRATKEATEVGVFHVRKIVKESDRSTPASRDRTLDEVAPVLNEMAGSVSAPEMIREVANELDVDSSLVSIRMQNAKAAPVSRPTTNNAESGPAAPRRKPTAEEERQYMMLALLMDSPKLGAEYFERLSGDHFSSPILHRAFEWLKEHDEAPLEGLTEEDGGLYNAIVRLQAVEHEVVNQGTLEFRWLLLERDRLDRALRREDDGARRVALQRSRAKVADRIASRSY